MAAGQRGDRRLQIRQQRHQAVIHRVGQHHGLLIEALAQSGRRRHPSNPQCMAEENVIADSLRGFEVILALAQEAQVGTHQVDVGDAMAQRHRLQALREPAASINDGADDGQAAGRGVNFGVALLEDERHRESHRLGEMTVRDRCALGHSLCVTC